MLNFKNAILAIVFVIIICTEAFSARRFSLTQRSGVNARSRFYKMISSSMFLLLGLLSALFSKNTSHYDLFMVIGFVFSWAGDLLLHIKNLVCNVFGALCFAAAHIIYIKAYHEAFKTYFPSKKFITLPEIIAVVVIMILAILFYVVIEKLPLFSLSTLVIVSYGSLLVSMLVKAASLGINLLKTSVEHGVISCAFLIIGAFLFFLSDVVLALLLFSEKDKGNIKIKDFNIITYYVGQTLLALTLLFIS